MPKRTDIHSIMIIGAGPIIIGQACEFDYSGAQACKALKEEGYRVILVNSNPATIMTDPGLADATYIEPITPEMVARVIDTEKPDALLPTMGGQTALNTAIALSKDGTLDRHGVELIGAKLEAIEKAEDRLLFRDAMDKIGLESPRSSLVHSVEEAMDALAHVGLPAIMRPLSPLAAREAVSPIMPRNMRRLSAMLCALLRSVPCWSRKACLAGKSTRWKLSATRRTIVSLSALSKMLIRWGFIPATALPSLRL